MIGSVEVHRQYRLPVLRFHLEKSLVPENPGIVDQDIHPPESIQGGSDDVFTAFRRGHVIVTGHGLAAQILDFLNHLVGRGTGSLPRAIPGAAEVIDHHPGAAPGQLQSISTSQSGARTGNDGHPAVKANLIFLSGRTGLRHRLPEITGKTAFIIGHSSPETHLDGHTHLDITEVTIGEVRHKAPAAFKLDHAVDGRRIDGHGQQIAREGHDFGRLIGKFIVILGMDMVTGRIDADVHLRILGRTAVPADAPHQPRDHLAFAPECRHGRLVWGFCPDSPLRIDQVSELQKFHVIIDRLLVLQGALDAHARRQLTDPVGHAKIKGIATLAESGQQDPVAGFRLFQGGHEHDQGVGGTRLPADLMHVVDHFFGISP